MGFRKKTGISIGKIILIVALICSGYAFGQTSYQIVFKKNGEKVATPLGILRSDKINLTIHSTNPNERIHIDEIEFTIYYNRSEKLSKDYDHQETRRWKEKPKKYSHTYKSEESVNFDSGWIKSFNQDPAVIPYFRKFHFKIKKATVVNESGQKSPVTNEMIRLNKIYKFFFND